MKPDYEKLDLRRSRYGRLTPLKRASNPKTKSGKPKGPCWLCKCTCGKKKVISTYSLLSGNTKSCGCLRVELNTKHGMINTPEIRIWFGIKERCSNQKSKRYFCRGITLSEDWQDFRNFYRDMGERPSKKMTIERIDNNKGYSKENCRWATRAEQANNRADNHMWEYEGKRMTIRDIAAARNFKGNLARVQMRLISGWSFEEAFNLPKYSHVRCARREGRVV